MLRALALRATDTAARAWTSIKTLGSLIARTPGWVGHAVLGILSTPAGYATTINAISLSIRAAYRIIDRGICLVGRLVASATGAAAGSISTIEPLQGTNPGEAQLQLLHFTLPGGLIVAQSYNVYPRGAVEIDPNKSLVSAITGGTGKYIGARGQIIHTRNADGTYTHRFALLK